MHRLLLAGLSLALLPAVGCATAPTTPAPETPLPSVNAGPPDPATCDWLVERLDGARAPVAEARWLDAPERMAEGRRMRALEARAASLGCLAPHG